MKGMKIFSQFLMALAILAGLLGAAAQPASAAAATNCTMWHTVVKGEYLVKIAAIYDTDWRTLAEINDLAKPSLIYPGQKLCVSTSGTPVVIPDTGTTGGSSSTSVRVYAQSVREDRYVTLRGRYLTANSRYSVYLSRYSAASSESFLVGSAYTDKNGSFTTTYYLPKKLVDVAKIGVSLKNSAGDSASNWFINATLEGNTGGTQAAAIGLSIVEIKKGQWVKIKASNLPADVTFDVIIGKAGSKGEKGVKVGTLVDDDGGGVRETFLIPDDLEEKAQLVIRLENKSLGIFTYLTFDNKTTK